MSEHDSHIGHIGHGSMAGHNPCLLAPQHIALFHIAAVFS